MRSRALLLLALALGCQEELSAGRLDRCALGAFADPGPGQTADEAMEELELLIGRSLDLERRFRRIDQDVPGAAERAISDAGRTPFVSISSTLTSGALMPWARLADPTDVEASALVDGLAGRLAAFDAPILILFHDEPQKDAANGTAADYVAAYRRMVTAARDAGADDVTWVWTLSSGAFPSEADAWYPGDEWVSWVGASGFNWYTGSPDSPWRTFPSIFGPFRAWGAARGKPLIISSVSSAEHPAVAPQDPRSKATWIGEAHATVLAWPEVQGLVWLHAPGPDETRDWHVDSSPSALAAFRTLGADAHFDVTGAREATTP